MKKSRQIFGAVALSAVLAFGTTVPAFANVVDDITGDDLQDANYTGMVTEDGENFWKEYDKANLEDGASTSVNIATYSSNYSVTVPLFAPFMLDTAGLAGIAPSNYGIKNGGEAAVFVTDVTWEIADGADGGWTFGAAKSDGTNPLDVVNIKNGTKPTVPEYGSFVITLTHTDSATSVETLVPAPTGTTGTAANNVMKGTKQVKWKIDPADANHVDGFNEISLAIEGSKLFKSLENVQTNVASIVYTVNSRAPEDITAGA